MTGVSREQNVAALTGRHDVLVAIPAIQGLHLFADHIDGLAVQCRTLPQSSIMNRLGLYLAKRRRLDQEVN
jgi:hypothetical protein